MIAEPQKSGCGLWVLMFLLVTAIGAFSLQGSVTAAVKSLLPLRLPVSVAATEENLSFMLQDNQIVYTYESTLDWPCNYIIQGRILDQQGKSVSDVLINIQYLDPDELTPEGPLAIHPADRADEYDPSLWVLLLPSWEVDYELWLTSESDGKLLSPHIVVEPQDCKHNVATLNFVQVHPFS